MVEHASVGVLSLSKSNPLGARHVPAESIEVVDVGPAAHAHRMRRIIPVICIWVARIRTRVINHGSVRVEGLTHCDSMQILHGTVRLLPDGEGGHVQFLYLKVLGHLAFFSQKDALGVWHAGCFSRTIAALEGHGAPGGSSYQGEGTGCLGDQGQSLD